MILIILNIVSIMWALLITLLFILRDRPVKVKFKRLSESAVMPRRANAFAAGIDFYASEGVIVPAGKTAAVPLGVAWEPSRNDCYLQLKGRSGLAFKNNIEASNAGVIDADYRGEIKALLENKGTLAFIVHKGDKCCQGIVLPLARTDIFEAARLSSTERGTGGFGSTGK